MFGFGMVRTNRNPNKMAAILFKAIQNPNKMAAILFKTLRKLNTIRKQNTIRKRITIDHSKSERVRYSSPHCNAIQ